MRKLIRIIGLIQIIQRKRNYSKAVRRNLISRLLYLEYKSFTVGNRSGEIKISLLGYKINAIGFENLRILFTEIFIEEEYQYFGQTDPGKVILDCGANIGMATLYFKWKHPECTIHAFEPDPVTFSVLQKNVVENQLKNVVIHNKAILDREDKIPFYVSSSEPGSLMMSTLPARMSQHKIEIPAIDFSAFIQEHALTSFLLKIDIEGAEQSVFNQLAETGSISKIEKIIMEYHHQINPEEASFSHMLVILENAGFCYNMITRFGNPGEFQDVLLYAFRSTKSS